MRRLWGFDLQIWIANYERKEMEKCAKQIAGSPIP